MEKEDLILPKDREGGEMGPNKPLSKSGKRDGKTCNVSKIRIVGYQDEAVENKINSSHKDYS